MHVAIRTLGRSRWAAERGLALRDGHEAGIRALQRIVDAAPDLEIDVLSIDLLPPACWASPEIDPLQDAYAEWLSELAGSWVRAGVAVRALGRLDRRTPKFAAVLQRLESVTQGGHRLRLGIAVDASARAELLRHAPACSSEPNEESFAAQFVERTGLPNVDLLVRTGGETRLGDFMLWQCAYAELLFSSIAWPDFTPADLAAARRVYGARERRFGGLGAPAPGVVEYGRREAG
jgi:undecaprenyl diphosphate synthase